MTVASIDGHSSAIDLAGGERIADPFHDIESQDEPSQTTGTKVKSSSPKIGPKLNPPTLPRPKPDSPLYY